MEELSKLEKIIDLFPDCTINTIKGFDDCIIGYVFDDDVILIYSSTKIINQLIKEGMSFSEAVDYIDSKISDTLIDGGTPILCNDILFNIDQLDTNGKAQ